MSASRCSCWRCCSPVSRGCDSELEEDMRRPALIYEATLRCPFCLYAFRAYVRLAEAPRPEQRFETVCPQNLSTIPFGGADLRSVGQPDPESVPATELLPPLKEGETGYR